MAATITSQFRKNNAIALITEGAIAPTSTGGFWIGIGKSDTWQTSSAASGSVVDSVIPVPDSSNGRANETLANLMCLRNVTAGAGDEFKPALVYPSNIWQTGRKYKVYDASNDACYYAESSGGVVTAYPCYISHNNNVYLCLGNNNTSSTAAPTTTVFTVLYETNVTDYYRWAFLYTIASGSPFNLFTFKPINNSASTNIISNAAKGKIYHVRVDNGGSDYTAGTAIGTGFKLLVTLSGGATTDITSNANITTTVSSGVIQSITVNVTTDNDVIISAASLTFTNNTTAKATILLSPISGFAETRISVIKALPCWYAAFYAYYNPAEYISSSRSASTASADLPNVNDYRQISLVRNPTRNAIATSGTANEESSGAVALTMDCLKFFVITTISDTALTTLTLDSIISQTATGALAYFDYYDSLNKHLYFHQNLTSAVNLLAFVAASSAITLNGVSYTYSSIGAPEYVPGTGEVLFLENRKSINRNENQSEEIKLIIQL